MGGHGDQMVPMPRFTTVKGIPITKLLPEEKINAPHRPDEAGRGGDRLTPEDRKRVLCACRGREPDDQFGNPRSKKDAPLFGVSRRAVWCPTMFMSGSRLFSAAAGIGKIIELELEGREREHFDNSVTAVRALGKRIL